MIPLLRYGGIDAACMLADPPRGPTPRKNRRQPKVNWRFSHLSRLLLLLPPHPPPSLTNLLSEYDSCSLPEEPPTPPSCRDQGLPSVNEGSKDGDHLLRPTSPSRTRSRLPSLPPTPTKSTFATGKRGCSPNAQLGPRTVAPPPPCRFSLPARMHRLAEPPPVWYGPARGKSARSRCCGAVFRHTNAAHTARRRFQRVA